MLICKTPLRISIAGGGTDHPSYYERFGGFVITATINKYIFIGINRIFTREYVVKYSALERVADRSDIQHPIIREAFHVMDVEPGIEMVSLADIPAGTGLGSSGCFTVGVMRALHALRCEYVSPQQVAEEACDIEMNRLGQPSGKQDQYASALGGINILEFEAGKDVRVSRLALPADAMSHLSDHLLMFFTGYSRSSEMLLADQQRRSQRQDEAMLNNLHVIKRIGLESRRALEAGNLVRYGELMHEHWLFKRERSEGMSNPCIDRWYEAGRASGAIGGKLVGAGGGGFLMFYTEDPTSLRRAMAAHGLEEIRFQFEHDGSTVVCRD
jgi:D-glycero-alpha-D-manno-heptose-7-phosphate kinase